MDSYTSLRVPNRIRHSEERSDEESPAHIQDDKYEVQLDVLKVNPISNLRRIALALGGLSVLFLLIVHYFLAQFWGSWVADRWFALALGVMLFLMVNFWRNLSRNYQAEEQHILPSLGSANTLTYLRGLFVAATAGFIAVPRMDDQMAWIPAIFYTLASLGDFMDGYMARRQGHSTRLGEILDMYVDGIGVLVATILLIFYEKVPTWYILVGLARYLYLGGIWLRKRIGKPVYDLPKSDVRRALAAVQMVFIFILLWPLFTPPTTAVAAAAFAVPFLLNFLYDWLLINGVLAPKSILPPRIETWLFGWLPVLLRLSITIFGFALALELFYSFPNQVVLYTRLGVPVPEIFLTLQALSQLMIFFMLLIGFSGRTAALAGLIFIGLQANYTPLTYIHYTLIVLFSAVFHFGTGFLSLWKPEDRLISLQAGHTTSVTDQPAAHFPMSSNSSLTEAA